MKFFIATFAALVLAATAQAAPFEAKNVAADAKWVVHVDVDAVRDSTVVKKAFATCPHLKDSGKHFDELKAKIGIDLRKDLHGVTLYGPDSDKKHVVAIVFSTVDQDLLIEKAKKASDHKVTKHGEIEIHSWTMKHGSKSEPAAGAFYKPDVMVFAADPAHVAAAIDVLDGKSPGITDPKSPLGGHVYKGASFIARANDVSADTRCPVLKQAVSFRVALGENDGKSFYHARGIMKTPEAAEQIQTIAEGFKAMASLRFSGDADMMKLVDGLKVTVRDSTVSVRWQASADDVWTVMEKMAKKAEEHFKKMKEMHDGKDGKHDAKHDGKHKTTSAITATAESDCPAGCQCPACKAKAKATAAAKSE